MGNIDNLHDAVRGRGNDQLELGGVKSLLRNHKTGKGRVPAWHNTVLLELLVFWFFIVIIINDATVLGLLDKEVHSLFLNEVEGHREDRQA